MFKESVAARAKEFKSFLYKTILSFDERIRQESLAFNLEIDPSAFNHYLNPDIDRNIPAFQVKRLPKEVRIPVVNFLIEDLGARIVYFSGDMKLDGRIDDEILLVGMLEGKLIEKKDKSPEEINKLLDQLQTAIDRMRLEVQGKVRK